MFSMYINVLVLIGALKNAFDLRMFSFNNIFREHACEPKFLKKKRKKKWNKKNVILLT